LAVVVPQVASRTCECVEAFIDITNTIPLPPVFYRCYWSTPTVTAYETLSFEWSATEEYIKWYSGNVMNTNQGVSFLITGSIGNNWVPLLKVTNHSPSSY
jgi:hypothetical protein